MKLPRKVLMYSTIPQSRISCQSTPSLGPNINLDRVLACNVAQALSVDECHNVTLGAHGLMGLR